MMLLLASPCLLRVHTGFLSDPLDCAALMRCLPSVSYNPLSERTRAEPSVIFFTHLCPLLPSVLCSGLDPGSQVEPLDLPG